MTDHTQQARAASIPDAAIEAAAWDERGYALLAEDLEYKADAEARKLGRRRREYRDVG